MLSYLYSPCLCLGHFCVPIGTVCLDCTQWRVRLVSPLNIKHKCGCKRELEAIVFCARRSGQKKKKKIKSRVNQKITMNFYIVVS